MSAMWTMVVIFGAAVAARLALPALPESIYGPVTARALFHAEWMLVATFLVLPLYEVARRSWRLALFVVPVASIHVLYIADAAVDASRQAGLVDGVSVNWYGVAFAQVGIFAVVGAVGACRNLADRRWVKFMQMMTADSPGAHTQSRPGLPGRSISTPPQPPEAGLAQP
jgi:hypothetical protein